MLLIFARENQSHRNGIKSAVHTEKSGESRNTNKMLTRASLWQFSHGPRCKQLPWKATKRRAHLCVHKHQSFKSNDSHFKAISVPMATQWPWTDGLFLSCFWSWPSTHLHLNILGHMKPPPLKRWINWSGTLDYTMVTMSRSSDKGWTVLRHGTINFDWAQPGVCSSSDFSSCMELCNRQRDQLAHTER